MSSEQPAGKMSTGESLEEAQKHVTNRLYQIRGDAVNIEELVQGRATFEDAAEEWAKVYADTIKGVAQAEDTTIAKVRKEFIMDFLEKAYDDANLPNPAATR